MKAAFGTQFFCGQDGDAVELENVASSTLRSPASWMYDWANAGTGNDAGVTVNGYTALTHCPLWQGVNIIAGDIAQVPIRLVKDGYTEQRQHPAWNLLRVRPNELQTPIVWLETMMQWALVWGNAVAYLHTSGSDLGRVVTDIVPLRPDCVMPELVFTDGQFSILYHYVTTDRVLTFLPWEVIHIQGITGDGIWGYPLHVVAKNTIGHGLALEKHGNKQFSNGARPSGILKHPGRMSQDARENLREEWDKLHGGSDNAGRIAILWEAMDFQAIAMSNIDAQWIEAKKLNRIDCASLLNLPAYKLNAMEDSSSRANLEEQNETYKQMTLTRWATKLDQEFRRKLLRDAEWMSDRYKFVFDWDVFMKADIDTLTSVGDRLVKATIASPNEARHMIGMPPREGGDEYGNPAIGQQQQPSDGEYSPDNGRPEGMENGIKALVLDRYRHILTCEQSRIRHAATHATNFVAWLDAFYLDGTFASLVSSIMAPVNELTKAAHVAWEPCVFVHEYARRRHSELLEVCSEAKPATLPECVDRYLANASAASEDVAIKLTNDAIGGVP